MRKPPSSPMWQTLVLERLHPLFAAVIVLQVAQCFGDFWWRETYWIVYGTVGVTIALELVAAKGAVWKTALQAAAAVYFTFMLAPSFHWDGWPDSWHSFAQIRHLLVFHGKQLHPFAEIALGVAVTVRLVAALGSRRAGAIFVIVASLAAMTIVDSFFPLLLWKNIAGVIAAGLGWLVVLHLKRLRDRHPDSWEALAKRPWELAISAVLVISLLMVSGVFVPRAPVLLKDPYTMWSDARGKVVPASQGEGGIVKIEPSKSDSAKSGYGRDDREIGGGFDFDYSTVMTVTTTRRSYWRGETKLVYSGKGWSDVRRDPSVIPFVQGSLDPLPLAGSRKEEAKTEQVVQTFTFERKDRMPVVFGAAPISLIQDIKSGDRVALKWNPNEWELRFNQPSRQESYTVVSEVPIVDEAAVRLAPHATNLSIDTEPYLQLPAKLPQRVIGLAAQIAAEAGASNDYDIAKALEKYLKTTFPYTNKPDLSKQKSADVVDAFLFEIQAGYCDYFSTSFVVMARILGLPARWVKGYSTGTNSANLDLVHTGMPTDPKGAGTYTVRNADAHSWAEVYFEGYGWLPFEPTSGFTAPVAYSEGQEADAEPEASTVPTVEQDEEPAAQTGVAWWIPTSGAVILLVLIMLVMLRKINVRRAGVVWNRIRYGRMTPDQRVVKDMERLLKFLKRRGLRREPHETIRETFARFGSRFGSMRDDFDGVLTQFERTKYGGGGGDEKSAADFAAATEKIRKAM